jgi:hypothetical protein
MKHMKTYDISFFLRYYLSVSNLYIPIQALISHVNTQKYSQSILFIFRKRNKLFYVSNLVRNNILI